MRKPKIEWRQGLMVGALLVLSLWLLSLIYSLAGKTELAWQRAHEVKVQYTELEARKNALQADLDALNTPRGQDAAIREAFGVARPGEEVIVVVPPATTTATSSESWWGWLTDWF